jgi:hypothetical protein
LVAAFGRQAHVFDLAAETARMHTPASRQDVFQGLEAGAVGLSQRQSEIIREIPCSGGKSGNNSLLTRNNSLLTRVGIHLEYTEFADVFETHFAKTARFREIPCIFPCDQGIMAGLQM